MKNKKTIKAQTPATSPVDLDKWIDEMIPKTPEMQAIATEESIKYHLVVALAKARKAAGYTQAQLAKKMGVKQSLISRWENVNQNHTLETLLQLCNAVNAELVMGLRTADEFIPITSAEHHVSINPNLLLENQRVSGIDKTNVKKAAMQMIPTSMVSSPARFASSYQHSSATSNILKLPPTPYEIAPITLKVIGGE